MQKLRENSRDKLLTGFNQIDVISPTIDPIQYKTKLLIYRTVFDLEGKEIYKNLK